MGGHATRTGVNSLSMATQLPKRVGAHNRHNRGGFGLRTVHGSLMKWQRMKCVFALLTVVLARHIEVMGAEALPRFSVMASSEPPRARPSDLDDSEWNPAALANLTQRDLLADLQEQILSLMSCGYFVDAAHIRDDSAGHSKLAFLRRLVGISAGLCIEPNSAISSALERDATGCAAVFRGYPAATHGTEDFLLVRGERRFSGRAARR